MDAGVTDVVASPIVAYLDAGRVVSLHHRWSRWHGLQLRDPFLQSWCVFMLGCLVHRVLILSPVNLQYEPRPVCGKPPGSRGYHVTIIADSRLLVFGGVSFRLRLFRLLPSSSVDSVQRTRRLRRRTHPRSCWNSIPTPSYELPDRRGVR